jgi:biopolymer transport protein ExbB/TolQ
MIDRLFKRGLITTIIGLVIILTSVFTWVFTHKASSDVAVIAGIGTGLLFLKDENIGIKRKNM